MSAVYVFTGPTLSPSDGRAKLDAIYLPPASQGDVYRVARERPRAIGIIDGFFDTLPAVWHKEILWAMHEGIPVFGSASMGALRAAELAAFGMRGVGRIFESYLRGELEDDDEVALAHEAAEWTGYRALSTPMVNIRATLAAAVAARVLTEEARAILVECVKGLFYPERSYRRLIAEGNAAGLRVEMDALAGWLPGGQVDAKREDALAMLAAMAEHVAGPRDDAPARFHFEHTTFWEGLRRSCDDARDPAAAQSPHVETNDLLDELRLQPGAFDRERTRALSHGLARRVGESEGHRVDGDRLRRAVEEFRRGRGLLDAESLDAWLAAHDLDTQTLARWLEDDAVASWAFAPAEVEQRVADEWKIAASYPSMRERAEDKDAALARAGLSEPGPADAGMTREEVIRWYFAEIAGAPQPSDLTAHLREAGFVGEQMFLRAVLREHLYRKVRSS